MNPIRTVDLQVLGLAERILRRPGVLVSGYRPGNWDETASNISQLLSGVYLVALVSEGIATVIAPWPSLVETLLWAVFGSLLALAVIHSLVAGVSWGKWATLWDQWILGWLYLICSSTASVLIYKA